MIAGIAANAAEVFRKLRREGIKFCPLDTPLRGVIMLPILLYSPSDCINRAKVRVMNGTAQIRRLISYRMARNSLGRRPKTAHCLQYRGQQFVLRKTLSR